MSRIAEAYKNHTVKVNETMEERMEDFVIQQEAEEELIQQAITDRAQEPTELPLIWCDYFCSQNTSATVRRRREVSDDDASNATTSNTGYKILYSEVQP